MSIFASDAQESDLSRLLAAVGGSASLVRLQRARVLVLGLRGVGVEVAKNLLSMGVGSLTVCDDGSVEWADLSSQFFLSESDVGRRRAEASREKLAALNARSELRVHSGPVDGQVVQQFSVVVCTDAGGAETERIAKLCRTHSVAFITSNVNGLFGFVFCDFGATFETEDELCEPEQRGAIESIGHSEAGVVSSTHEHRLRDGDTVVLSDVLGMVEVNGREFAIKVVSRYAFSIGSVLHYSQYVAGGAWREVRKPKQFNFAPWSECVLRSPTADKVSLADPSHSNRTNCYYLALRALHLFRDRHNRLPRPANRADADEVVALAQQVNERLEGASADLAETLTRIHCIARQAAGSVAPMSALFGGVIAHEALKAATHRFTPLNQWLMFDALACLPSAELTEDAVRPQSCRYDGQIALFGRDVHAALCDARYLVAGAGAVGCEVLKNLALMGVGTGAEGAVAVVDTRRVGTVHLPSQFLYGPADISKPKSLVAAAAVASLNPHMHLTAHTEALSNEAAFPDSFWLRLSGVCDAIDTEAQRNWMAHRCAFFRKPLLAATTYGCKAEAQVLIPHVTEALCTDSKILVKEVPGLSKAASFPFTPLECVHWARELLFTHSFADCAETAAAYVTQPDYLASRAPHMRRSTLETLREFFVAPQRTLDDCVAWARKLFDYHFNLRSRDLLYRFPADLRDRNGVPFWSGNKRAPTIVSFDAADPLHLAFVVAAAHMRAYNVGLLDSELKPADLSDRIAHIQRCVAALKCAEWRPPVQSEENADAEDQRVCEEILAALPPPETLRGQRINVINFERDDDRFFHSDLIFCAASIRAIQYRVEAFTRLQCRLMAGRIVPTAITTAASLSGLMCLEAYKLVQAKQREEHCNSALNLALATLTQAPPAAAALRSFAGREVSPWDRIDVRLPDATLASFLQFMKSTYNLDVDLIGAGSSLLCASFMPAARKKERLPMHFSELVATVTKAPPLPSGARVELELTATIDEEDVEPPPVTLWL